MDENQLQQSQSLIQESTSAPTPLRQNKRGAPVKKIIIAVIILCIILLIGTAGYLLGSYHVNFIARQNSTNTKIPSLLDYKDTPASRSSSSAIGNCQNINSSSNYSLTSDITTNDICFNIHDTNNVTIDCKNHVISSKFGTIIQVKNTTNFVIKNCTLKVTNENGGETVEIQNSKSGIIQNNAMVNGEVNGRQNHNIQFLNNSVTTHIPYVQTESFNNVIKGNTFTSDTAVNQTIEGSGQGEGSSGGSAIVTIQDGNNNVFEDNVLDGKWDGVLHPNNNGNVGVDDGILLANEKQDTISSNTINNNWDCGIENIGHLEDVQMMKNTITNAGICGIGGWYWNSWKNVTVSSNTFDTLPTVFFLYRAYGFDATHNEQAVYFLNNTFSDNIFLHPKAHPGKEAVAGSFSFGSMPPEIPISAVTLGNNVFKNNNFGPNVDGPFITPANMIVDEGGDTCLAVNDTSHPLVCK